MADLKTGDRKTIYPYSGRVRRSEIILRTAGVRKATTTSKPRLRVLISNDFPVLTQQNKTRSLPASRLMQSMGSQTDLPPFRDQVVRYQLIPGLQRPARTSFRHEFSFSYEESNFFRAQPLRYKVQTGKSNIPTCAWDLRSGCGTTRLQNPYTAAPARSLNKFA